MYHLYLHINPKRTIKCRNSLHTLLFRERISRQNTLNAATPKALSSEPLLSGELDLLECSPLIKYTYIPLPALLQTLPALPVPAPLQKSFATQAPAKQL